MSDDCKKNIPLKTEEVIQYIRDLMNCPKPLMNPIIAYIEGHEKLITELEADNKVYSDEIANLNKTIGELDGRLDRYEKDCEVCGGKGFTQHKCGIMPKTNEPLYHDKPCPTCNGTGKVPRLILPNWVARLIIKHLIDEPDDIESVMEAGYWHYDIEGIKLTRIDSDTWEVEVAK